MDSIKGAIELRKLFKQRGATSEEKQTSGEEVPADAPPLFHWLGVIPASDAAQTPPPTP